MRPRLRLNRNPIQFRHRQGESRVMEPVATSSFVSPWLLVAGGLILIFWPAIRSGWQLLAAPKSPSAPRPQPKPAPPPAGDIPQVIDRQFAFRFLDELDRHFEVAGNDEGRAAIQAAGRALFISPIGPQPQQLKSPIARVRA